MGPNKTFKSKLWSIPNEILLDENIDESINKDPKFSLTRTKSNGVALTPETCIESGDDAVARKIEAIISKSPMGSEDEASLSDEDYDDNENRKRSGFKRIKNIELDDEEEIVDDDDEDKIDDGFINYDEADENEIELYSIVDKPRMDKNPKQKEPQIINILQNININSSDAVYQLNSSAFEVCAPRTTNCNKQQQQQQKYDQYDNTTTTTNNNNNNDEDSYYVHHQDYAHHHYHHNHHHHHLLHNHHLHHSQYDSNAYCPVDYYNNLNGSVYNNSSCLNELENINHVNNSSKFQQQSQQHQPNNNNNNLYCYNSINYSNTNNNGTNSPLQYVQRPSSNSNLPYLHLSSTNVCFNNQNDLNNNNLEVNNFNSSSASTSKHHSFMQLQNYTENPYLYDSSYYVNLDNFSNQTNNTNDYGPLISNSYKNPASCLNSTASNAYIISNPASSAHNSYFNTNCIYSNDNPDQSFQNQNTSYQNIPPNHTESQYVNDHHSNYVYQSHQAY